MNILTSYWQHRDTFDADVRRIVPDATITRLRPDDDGFADAWRNADVFLGWPLFKEGKPGSAPEDAKHLEWVQTTSAGIASINGKVPDHWQITTAAGVYGETIAEHVFALMLYFRCHLHRAVEAQQQRTWGIGDPAFVELTGQTLAILGLGDIGRNVAVRAAAFGMRVVGMRREASALCPPGVDKVVGNDALDDLLAEADVVVAALPGTKHTRGRLDARRLSLMKPDAGLVNVGRGSLIDSDALATQLAQRPESWAGLDVTHPEPLPGDHALWGLPNVLITPHVCGRTNLHAERFEALFLHNLQHFVNGDPTAMTGVFDRHWEY